MLENWKRFKWGISLKSLLVEEERHLAEMEEKIECNISSVVVHDASGFEDRLFLELAEGITEELYAIQRGNPLLSVDTFTSPQLG